MVQGKWFPQGSDISVPLALRQAVFARGRDNLDDLAQQTVVYEEGMPVGAARLWWAEGSFHIGDVGVLEAKRGKGFGDLLIRLLLFKALAHHATCVEVDAIPSAATFFSRYGFRLEGELKRVDSQEGDGPVHMRLLGEELALGCAEASCGKGCEGCRVPK